MTQRTGMFESGRVLWPVIIGLALGIAIVVVLRSRSGAAGGDESPVVEAMPAVSGVPMSLPAGISPEDVQLIELPLPVDLDGEGAVLGAAEVTGAAGSLVVSVVWGDDGSRAVGVRLAVRSAVLPHHRPPRIVTTDADGQVRLDGLPVGGVTADGDRGGTVSAVIVADETAEARLVLPVGPMVHGVVLDPDGDTVAGADIWLSVARTTRSGQVLTQSAHDGSFSLRSIDTWHFLEARGAGWGPSGVSRVPEREASRVDLTLRMTRHSGDVTVRVQTRDGDPILDAVIQLGGEWGWTLEPLEGSNGFPHQAPHRRGVTDHDGVSDFEGVPPGETELLVRAPGHAPSKQDVVVKEGQPTEIVVTPLPAAGLSGRVLAISEDGLELVGVPGALVTATPVYSAARPGGFLETVVLSGEDGVWAMDELAPGPDVTLVATHDVHGQATRREKVGARMREGIDLGLTRGLEIRGMVVDPNGLPLAGWPVVAQSLSIHEHLEEASTETDESGAFAIFNRRAVPHTLLVREPVPHGIATVLRLVDVFPDQEPVTLVVRASAMSSAEIVFALADTDGLPVSGASVSVSSTDRRTAGRVIETKVPGNYHTTLLPPGEYELRVWPSRLPQLLLEDLILAAHDRLDLGTLTLGGGGRIAVKLSLPPGLEDTTTWVYATGSGGVWQGNMHQTAEGWQSDLLEPGTYLVSANGLGVAAEVRTVEVASGQTRSLSIEMEPGLLCLFVLHGLADSATAAVYEERSFGYRFLRLEVDDSSGRPAARQNEGMDTAITTGTPMRMIVHLRPGRYTARVKVGRVTIAETDFTVSEGQERGSVTRLDVMR